ncbi:unnamed protein product [Prunus armeniaca]|uniref:Uncharacterized protein n=1 Tax=Prunus armeniaca TaxID=36596 RepID=A0A6J5UQH8_PRUAR|nr:unnamed protein product [Prunus armeniaca]
MAATFSLTKRSLFNISKSLPEEHHFCFRSCLSNACFSTSFERAQDPRNRPPTEASRDEGGGRDEGDTRIDNMSGATGFVGDTARQGTAKAAEVAEDLVEMAKERTDFAWDSTKNKTQKVGDTLVAEADENIIDTTEYRNMEDKLSSQIMMNIFIERFEGL